MMTTPSEIRCAPVSPRDDLELRGGGQAAFTVSERDRVQPFLLLHGGAGPASVAAFGDLLAARKHARVIVPTHPGFDGTPRPEALSSVGDLARLYAELLDRLGVWDVT